MDRPAVLKITESQLIQVVEPPVQAAPVVFSSPHSGRNYTPEFLARTSLDPLTIRRSEDSFVDEIFAEVPEFGAPLVKALFPRAYVDPNREPYELDPAMFREALPAYANTRSPRVAAGLGTIPRVVASGAEIYKAKLGFAEARSRIETYYRSYHAALTELIRTTKARFGFCVLIDCHSMPSVGGPMENDAGRPRRVDIILGDGHGATCAPGLIALVEQTFHELSYTVRRNAPYSGGYITRSYGRPAGNVHALQIEINRALYMDEQRIRRTPRIETVGRHMNTLAEHLCRLGHEAVAA